jgi:hypothetical protein
MDDESEDAHKKSLKLTNKKFEETKKQEEREIDYYSRKSAKLLWRWANG